MIEKFDPLLSRSIQGIKEVPAGIAEIAKPVGTKALHHTTYRSLDAFYRLTGRPIVEGALPEEGPSLTVPNHRKAADIFMLFWLMTKHTGNFPTYVVKDTLVDTDVQEEPEVLERTGKTDVLNSKSSAAVNARKVLAGFIRQFPTIPVHRGQPARDFYSRMDRAFQNGENVIMFGQETRDPKDDLLAVMPGAAFIARRHPDVPVYVMGVSESETGRDIVRVANPFTCNQLGTRTVSEIREHVVWAMAERLPIDLRRKWTEQNSPGF
ncbi:MAG: 1-acyl-sn-glycerol-3-phosphate acyltransferase [Patescibacteria group bacterium]|nr:1-acyl-sn-glycerol-3-phosphate acyltransferase [Patescibacteria group bacterium]